MSKKALICGFIGRENFGDELMLHLHTIILKDLGYSVYHTTDAVYFRYIKDDYYFAKKLIEPYDMSFDLILYGGGALPLHFLSELLIKYRTIKPSTKIIASCINLFKKNTISDLITSFYNNIFDCMIFREEISSEISAKLRMKHCFLPDIVTTLDYQGTKQDKTAVIIRDDLFSVAKNNIILPKDDFDILVMSASDDVYNQNLTSCSIKKIYKNNPLDQYYELMSYKKILSIGRFHAALCGKNISQDTCYLYPFVRDSMILESDQKLFSWEELKNMEYEQMQKDSENNLFCKTGTLSKDFYDYPSCKLDDYKNYIQDFLQQQ